MKRNCWEFKKCGKDKTGDCPAYPKGGTVCYLLKGTKCEKSVQGSYALKIEKCRECDFYREMHKDNLRNQLGGKDHLEFAVIK